jgi:hypothetical protein
MSHPLPVLSSLLADAKRQGRPFDAVWPQAVSTAVKGAPGWRSTIEATADEWRCCYTDAPSSSQHLRAALMALREGCELRDVDREREGIAA